MTIILEPIGGLGNQLFIYALGKEMQRTLGATVLYDISNYRTYKSHNYELDSFVDGENLDIINKESNRKFYYLRFLQKKTHLYPKLSKILFPMIHFENAFGTYSDSIFNKKNIFTAKGFFQSWKYFINSQELVRDNIKQIIEPTPWFLEMKNMLIKESKFTAIHFRGGDYKNIPTMGLLKKEYHKSAIRTLKKMN